MMKEQEVRLDTTEASMLRCVFELRERKRNAQSRELLGLEPVSLVIKEDRLRWFGHIECKDADFIKSCMKTDAGVIRGS